MSEPAPSVSNEQVDEPLDAAYNADDRQRTHQPILGNKLGLLKARTVTCASVQEWRLTEDLDGGSSNDEVLRGDNLVTLIVECFADEAPDGITVYFEPEGADHRLMPGDSLRVEAYPPDGERIEVAHHPDGLSLHVGHEWGVRAFRRDGTQLRL
jgi:hypothetical protein